MQSGFRRIGRTPYFAYSTDPEHRSRSLAAKDDVPSYTDEAPQFHVRDIGVIDIRSFSDDRGEVLKSLYPLHYEIENRRDLSIIAILEEAYNRDPQSIHAQDDQGHTAVFIAARCFKVSALNTLLKLGATEDLLRRDNIDAKTPLEALTYSMQRNRDFIGMISLSAGGAWPGF